MPIPTRGIATADTRGDGRLDFAVARQWGPPAFYANESPDLGHYLGLELYRPAAGGGRRAARAWRGSAPRRTARPCGCHTPGTPRSPSSTGAAAAPASAASRSTSASAPTSGPVAVHLQWRDSSGQHHQQTSAQPRDAQPLLTNTATEVPTR